jgi:hypothetical protein
MSKPMIHRRDLRARLGICARTLARWAKSGKVPPPDVNVNSRSQWWHPATLEAAGLWVEASQKSDAESSAA